MNLNLEFSKKSRHSNLDTLKTKEIEFDLCIVGGGITGAGVAREAASRGMKVVLFETNDFSSGTSSRSSKLIHGGIRYLENFEFGLVFEALSERRLLFQMAPHLVHPLRFLLPVYKDSRVGMLKLGLGMWLYDLLALFEMPELHERLNAQETLERVPSLNGTGLIGSYVYSDAYMDDDRLVIETLRSAQSFGALVFSYVNVTGVLRSGGKLSGVQIHDKLGGQNYTVQAKQFVSCVGPWTDVFGHQVNPQWKPIMRPSKGIHLTFSRDRLPLSQAMVMAVDKENRIVFGIPRHDMVIVGTTDTDFTGNPENVHSSVEDVDYLLKVTSEYFPGAKLKKSDILASYSGVRPLVQDGSETESKTSREHVILNPEENLVVVSGGKYTTYRLMAEQSVEKVLDSLTIEERSRFGNGCSKEALNPLVTEEKFAEAARSAETWAREFGWTASWAELAASRHGMEAIEILQFRNPSMAEEANYWQNEARFAAKKAMCLTLKDFYLRRTPLFLAREDHGLSMMDAIGEGLGLSVSDLEQQKLDLKAHLNSEMGWRK